MLAIQNPFKLKKFYLHFFVFLSLILVLIAGQTGRKAVLLKSLVATARAPVYSIISLSPSPSPMALAGKPTENVAVKPQNKPLGKEKVLAKSTVGSVCKDIKDSWTMVPNSSGEELFTICNVKTEKMAIADELNIAQNNYRTGHGLNTLNINLGLCRIAASRAKEIANSFSHDGFEDAVDSSGLGFGSYGENIASGPLSATKFVEWSWDRSPGHKANMLGDWSDGCGGVADKYAVFLFAR